MVRTVVLGFAKGVPGRWEAICVDFDIAVQGQSFEEAKRALEAAVISYIESASREDPKTARRLLARRAPLWVTLRLAGSFLIHLVNRKSRNGAECKAGFDIPCHA